MSGEASDSAFVLAAQRFAKSGSGGSHTPATQFFLLRIDPSAARASQRARLSPLAVPVQPAGSDVRGIAVSPDGAKLAVISLNWHGPASAARTLHVFSLASGGQRSWAGLVFSGYQVATQYGLLSWEADSRTLEVLGCHINPSACRVRLLDTSKQDSLTADSRVAAQVPGTISGRAGLPVLWRDVTVTPDGRTLILSLEITSDRPARVSERLEKIAVLPRHGTLLLNTRTDIRSYEQILWSSPNGHVLIVTGAGHGGGGAGIYTGTRYTQIPWAGGIIAAAW